MKAFRRSRCRGLSLLGVGALALPTLLVSPASGAPIDLDLSRTYETRFTGAEDVGGAGDVTGDGRPDVVLTKASADPYGRTNAGAAYVWTGRRRESVSVRQTSFEGFRIAGSRQHDNLSSACVIGDLNGDGRREIVLGAQTADTPNGDASGAAYVVFGKASSGDVDLRDFHDDDQNTRGFRIDGGGTFALAGWRVACLGDVNADGLDDLAIAAPFAAATYVVFGKSDTNRVDLKLFDLNAQLQAGFRIDTPAPQYSDLYSVGAAGDTNGDGYEDVVIGVTRDPHDSPGSAYVVYGKTDTLPVDVATEGNEWGYRIRGERDGYATGTTVSGAGDANGDGLADVVVGAHRLYRNLPGRAYVVFGSAGATDVRLANLSDRGFEIRGGPGRDRAGTALAAAGDVNGDGLDDVLVGAPWAGARGRWAAGVVYVVFGSESSSPVSVRELEGRGHLIVGARRGDQIGSSAAAFRERGRARLLVGSWRSLQVYLVTVRSTGRP
ncbi:MAG: integrin alpha [Actinomycetota bacterium]|nr:integrin alpha [Actinomycetota bacterium]